LITPDEIAARTPPAGEDEDEEAQYGEEQTEAFGK
jgi:hypothetical protein